MTEPTPAAEALSGTDREIAYVLIDVQRKAIGILTAVRRIRAIQRNSPLPLAVWDEP